MAFAEHFQQSFIEENQVFLTEEEEAELAEYLDVLIESQNEYNADKGYGDEDAKSLAMLSFVAGRSYQRNHDRQTESFMEAIEDPGSIYIRLTPGAASQLIQRLLKEE